MNPLPRTPHSANQSFIKPAICSRIHITIDSSSQSACQMFIQSRIHLHIHSTGHTLSHSNYSSSQPISQMSIHSSSHPSRNSAFLPFIQKIYKSIHIFTRQVSHSATYPSLHSPPHHHFIQIFFHSFIHLTNHCHPPLRHPSLVSAAVSHLIPRRLVTCLIHQARVIRCSAK